MPQSGTREFLVQSGSQILLKVFDTRIYRKKIGIKGIKHRRERKMPGQLRFPSVLHMEIRTFPKAGF